MAAAREEEHKCCWATSEFFVTSLGAESLLSTDGETDLVCSPTLDTIDWSELK